jgi:hypothetical protein
LRGKSVYIIDLGRIAIAAWLSGQLRAQTLS